MGKADVYLQMLPVVQNKTQQVSVNLYCSEWLIVLIPPEANSRCKVLNDCIALMESSQS